MINEHDDRILNEVQHAIQAMMMTYCEQQERITGMSRRELSAVVGKATMLSAITFLGVALRLPADDALGEYQAIVDRLVAKARAHEAAQ